MRSDVIGIRGLGVYLPDEIMTAKDISQATGGRWSEEDVINKLGIRQKYIPGKDDGTQEMGARASQMAIEDAGIDPLDIDVILCFGEEWKEYPLTTSALYIQDYIGATNAWGIDLQNRCCSTISAMKIGKDMILADPHVNTILIAGGYRNGDFVDYKDPDMSMMYNLSAGGGAIILQRGYEKNQLLASHIISDGSLARTAGVEIGGIKNPITKENINQAYKSLRLMQAKKMKDRLNEVSMPNWLKCIDKALEKSSLQREDIDFLNILHIKRSGHLGMLKSLNLDESQTFYLENYGHIGQVDQILTWKIARDLGLVKDGYIIATIAAGIGYVWAANIVRWGK
ncbi:MAG: 3-oxoacyl-ACP synthase [Tissierellia bacterium]|nr:3-oxoacyl-ACP synthase [Tissierellia bacterium]